MQVQSLQAQFFFVGSNFSTRCSTKPEEICGLGEGSCSQNDHCGEDDDGTDDLDLAGGGGDADADPDGLIEILDCFRGRSSLQPEVQRHGEKF